MGGEAEQPVPLLVERDGAVLRLVLDRPQAGNGISLAMARALMRAAIAADEDETVRCVLLTGRGRLFCAGGDIHEFAVAGDGIGAYLKEVTACLHAAIIRLLRMPKPLVVAVNGPAAGAGFSLAMAGDIVLASARARFIPAYGALGYTPDGGLSWLLPRLVGLRRAQEILLANRALTAEEAVGIGLATRILTEDDLEAAALEQARTLSSCATGALGRMRGLLLDASQPLEAHLDAEARAISASARTAHGREGVAAFLAKRLPDFTAV
ncbi:enoyl-CoA hydratase/isomerase family protein [Niveispirillum fermenti]|uniref:enoyl-CoA hydratase/isomerase family protein n=1 Tax=Niveispirillum fermenti TaxID=1233113 RepID=UPI003A8ACD2C